jgi:hypothetical protein
VERSSIGSDVAWVDGGVNCVQSIAGMQGQKSSNQLPTADGSGRFLMSKCENI